MSIASKTNTSLGCLQHVEFFRKIKVFISHLHTDTYTNVDRRRTYIIIIIILLIMKAMKI